MNGKYILNDKGNPEECDDLMKWVEWIESNPNRQIARTEKNDVLVSTVFLGLDHSLGMSPTPILYETMIFGGECDGYQTRYATREEALKGHEKAVKLAGI